MRPGYANRPPGTSQRHQPRAASPAELLEYKTAAALREAYQRERSRYESLRTGTQVSWHIAKRYDGIPAAGPEQKAVPAVWPRLACFCLEHALDVTDYVRFLFDRRSGLGRAPEPPELGSDRFLRLYQEHQASGAQVYQARISLTSQRAAAGDAVIVAQRFSHMSMDAACAYVLCDDRMDLSPLFRVGVALSLHGECFQRIADLYMPDAALEYMRNRLAYREAWKGFLPADFDTTIQITYRELAGS